MFVESQEWVGDAARLEEFDVDLRREGRRSGPRGVDFVQDGRDGRVALLPRPVLRDGGDAGGHDDGSGN